MKYIFLLFCLCLSGSYAQAQNMDQEWTRSINDPIQLMKQILEKQAKQWEDESMNTIFTSYGEEGVNDAEYIFLQSPGQGTDFFQIGSADVGNFISKERFLEVLKDAANTEQKASVKLARATISESLKEYEKAFELAQKLIKTNSINYQEAIDFLDNRFGFAKLEHAKSLLDKSTTTTEIPGNSTNTKRAMVKIEELDRTYFDKIPLVTALIQLDEFYDILRETNTGLAGYAPYTNFKLNLDYLNQLRIDERRRWKTSIKITYPAKNTVLSVKNPVDITWETANIDSDKTIRFFLVKDDMMVQELGIFKNNQSVSGIELEKNIEPGDNFKIMAIELFPADKFKIAKFVTPSFSIKNETRNKVAETVKRTEFAGRKITYVQELVVRSKNITIDLWDNKEQDGDIVSVYLNGDSIIAKYSLTKDKKQFQVQLNASKSNDIFLFAHNLGTIPPNTVSIEISDGTTSEKIVLNSDLSSSEAVLIKVK
ncbi:MAG: tetratricopeptide (TPR) repeat protein [Psychroserpens sp.]|jgi:tetratricopeptide (TPR) repeat protein